MTKSDLQYILRILKRIKEPDGYVNKGIATIERDLAQFEARKGQMRDMYYNNEGSF